MYFPNGVAKVLARPSDEPIISLVPNARKSLFLTLTANALHLWSARPPVLLATIERTAVSLESHGLNASVYWEGVAGRSIIVQTSASHLILIKVQRTRSTPYASSTLGPSVARRFQPGPGEAHPLAGFSLILEGVVGIEGGLLHVSPRDTHILFTTSEPSAVQRIPWPNTPSAPNEQDPRTSHDAPPFPSSPSHPTAGPQRPPIDDGMLGHETWFLEHEELPWLVRNDVRITSITASPQIGYEGWITSDGRAYLVYLAEEEPDEPEDDAEPERRGRSTTISTAAGTAGGRSVASARNDTRGNQRGSVSPSGRPSSSSTSHPSRPPASSPSPTRSHASASKERQSQSTPSQGSRSRSRSGSRTPSNATRSASRSPSRSRSRSGSSSDSEPGISYTWEGICIHGTPEPSIPSSTNEPQDQTPPFLPENKHATRIAFNSAFSLVAIGTSDGCIHLSDLPSSGVSSGQIQTLRSPVSVHAHSSFRNGNGSGSGRGGMGKVTSMEWTQDGYALAVGWEGGWGVWSVGGKMISCSTLWEGERADADEGRFDDAFMDGVINLTWAQGDTELLVLAPRPQPSPDPDVAASRRPAQLFSMPFAKSALTGQQSMDNTRYGVLQVDNGIMIYRGADQPDMSIINPEADVWQHIKVPATYMASHWPIRYTSISSDGRLLAVAGRRGLLNWSAISGRWKMFADPREEMEFSVRGGMVWFHHVLIVGVELSDGRFEIRLYSRDLDLTASHVLHREPLTAPVIVLSLIDNSLLVYTADNTVHHFLILTTPDSVRSRLCGSISFEGVIGQPAAVRGLSWMIPKAQKDFGDPVNDLAVATVLMLLGGRLILLRPRKVGPHEVRYDMQILHERIEFCWIHLAGIGALENSLWGYDGNSLRIWLNALTLDKTITSEEGVISVRESVNIPLVFYPVACLMEKGVIIGLEHEVATRATLPFAMFRTVTSTHLFLHHVLLYHLRRSQTKEALTLASTYTSLVFFAHALEVLLHTILEADPDSQNGQNTHPHILELAIELIDHFDSSLEVVVGCARKTEISRWRRLFDIVGDPKDLFETCLKLDLLKTAGSYLLVLHNLEQLDQENEDAIRLLHRAILAQDWTLSKELLHFLKSIDESGTCLHHALEEVGLAGVSATRSLPESLVE